MKELVSHIEFLILQHEYVIVPGLGGFVLNQSPACINNNGVVVAPVLRLGFNRDLKFNDGLLAESYMQRYNLSYDIALKRIDQSVKEVVSELNMKKTLVFGSLGVLIQDSDNILFEPVSSAFRNHPAVWGYSDLELKRLSDITIPLGKKLSKRKVKFKHVLAGVASTAAAFVLLALSSSINENLFQTVQQSGFFIQDSEFVAKMIERKSVISSEKNAIISEYLEQLEIASAVEDKDLIEEVVEIIQPVKEKVKVREKRYFIIVAGDENRSRANTLLSTIKKKGFNGASLIDSPERYRIYVAVFKDKAEANVYLNRFRNKYPAYQDAWLYTKSVVVES